MWGSVHLLRLLFVDLERGVVDLWWLYVRVDREARCMDTIPLAAVQIELEKC